MWTSSDRKHYVPSVTEENSSTTTRAEIEGRKFRMRIEKSKISMNIEGRTKQT